MERRLDAQRLTYDTLINKWVAIDGTDRRFNNISESIEYFQRKEVPGLNFSPSELEFKQQKPDQMNLTTRDFRLEWQVSSRFYLRYLFLQIKEEADWHCSSALIF
jgi:hypothetical protein